MKKIFFLVLFVSRFILLSAQQNFEVLSKKPVAGSVVSIEYMPRNTVLQGVQDIEATAYLLEGKVPLAKSIPLTQQGGIFKGQVKTNDSTRAVFFSFGKDELRDNNKDEGYYTVLYDKKGNMVPGANHALGMVFETFGGIWGMQRNKEKGLVFSKKEFESPHSRAAFHNDYLFYLNQSGTESDKALLKAELAKKLERTDLSEADLLAIQMHYLYSLGDKVKADSVMALVRTRFPDGTWKGNDAMNAFFGEKALAAKVKVYNELRDGLKAPTTDEQGRLDMMAGQLAQLYVDSGDYAAVKKYLSQIHNATSRANTLNNIAWKLSGEGVNKKPLNTDLGLELSRQSLDLISQEIREMKNKVSYMTEKQYVKNLNNTYHNFSDTYAVLLYHKGEYEKAYTLSENAVAYFKRKNVELNENFTVLTEKVKGKAEAQAELEQFVEEGSYSPAMKEQFKVLYLSESNRTEAQWASYLTNLEEKAYNKLKTELLKKMIRQPAPSFVLKDLSGKEVSLNSLKGKVVVVDFWATWCGPCVASFPGMQKAVDRFKNNSDVVFLFVNTRENDSNRVQKVTDFIAKNNYSFTVLYDEAKSKSGNDFTVIGNYKVDGIPTKFVIDRNHNIRFKSVGYSGSPDATLSEMTAMIDLAAAESGEPIKKAF